MVPIVLETLLGGDRPTREGDAAAAVAAVENVISSSASFSSSSSCPLRIIGDMVEKLVGEVAEDEDSPADGGSMGKKRCHRLNAVRRDGCNCKG